MSHWYADVEAIRGDMRWSALSERCMKASIGYKISIEKMPEDRWTKKVCEHVGIQSKWSKSCKIAAKKFGLKSGYVDLTNRRGMWQVKSADTEGNLWSNSKL